MYNYIRSQEGNTKPKNGADKMDKFYVLMNGFNYEGLEFEGLYKNREDAVEEGERLKKYRQCDFYEVKEAEVK